MESQKILQEMTKTSRKLDSEAVRYVKQPERKKVVSKRRFSLSASELVIIHEHV